MNSETIFRFGTLMKEEQVQPVNDKIIPGTMVLETPEPFPGYLEYYSETPHDPRPLFIYLGLHEENHYEDIARASAQIHKKTDIRFSSAFGSISIKYDMYKVLRLRYLSSFDDVMPLQELFAQEGIRFRRPMTPKGSQKGLIRLKKMFQLEKLGDGMYRSANERKMAYFSLPEKVSWNQFEELVARVRHNWHQDLVDFALGSFYHYEGIEDMVRVYCKNQRPELVAELKQLFADKM